MKKGFTLSEVLITLGVVGVVAVLTIPGVMKNYQNRLYTAQLEKVYAQVSDAVQSVMNDEHVDNFYETSAGGSTVCTNPDKGECTSGLGYFLPRYFKTIKKNCLGSDSKACMSSTQGFYKSVSGSNIAGAHGNYFVQTITGASIGGFYNASNNCTSLIVDVNGMGEPNVAGRDVFTIDIRSNGTLADYGSACLPNNIGATAASCTSGGTMDLYSAASGCLNNVIEAGWKMEY